MVRPSAKEKPDKPDKKRKKFKDAWLTLPLLQDWLSKNTDPNTNIEKEAWCKACRCPLRAHKTDLERHTTTDKHVQAFAALPTRSNSFAETQKSKVIDMKLAVHVACHSSVKTIDHLGEILKEVGQGSGLASLKLHRTKCSKIITK
ncbi:hypothetical protein FOCC_FOCC013523, partial [Frankliniella occidentalis]